MPSTQVHTSHYLCCSSEGETYQDGSRWPLWSCCSAGWPGCTDPCSTVWWQRDSGSLPADDCGEEGASAAGKDTPGSLPAPGDSYLENRTGGTQYHFWRMLGTPSASQVVRKRIECLVYASGHALLWLERVKKWQNIKDPRQVSTMNKCLKKKEKKKTMKIITTQMFCEQPTRDSIRCHDRIVSRLRNNQGLHLKKKKCSWIHFSGAGLRFHSKHI